jgi:hypothetical protein
MAREELQVSANGNAYLPVDKGPRGQPSSIQTQLSGVAITGLFRDAFGSPPTVAPRRQGSTLMSQNYDNLVSSLRKRHPHKLGFKIHVRSCYSCKKFSYDLAI